MRPALPGALQDVLDQIPVLAEQWLTPEQRDRPEVTVFLADPVDRLDVRHGVEDPVHHRMSHSLEQIGELRIRSHVVLEAVEAAQVAVVSRHEHERRPLRLRVDRVREHPEPLEFGLSAQVGQVAPLKQNLLITLGKIGG